MTTLDSNRKQLQEIVRRESRSLLQYVSDAFPWTTPAEQEALVPLHKLVAEQREAVAALGRYLSRHKHAVPYLGSYPMSFTSINFTALEHLLPILADDARRAAERLDGELKEIAEPEARTLVERILETRRRQEQVLKSLATAYPETHATVR